MIHETIPKHTVSVYDDGIQQQPPPKLWKGVYVVLDSKKYGYKGYWTMTKPMTTQRDNIHKCVYKHHVIMFKCYILRIWSLQIHTIIIE